MGLENPRLELDPQGINVTGLLAGASGEALAREQPKSLALDRWTLEAFRLDAGRRVP